MRVAVVSDVHASVAALADAVAGVDALLCLGDLLLFIDYDDYTQGIFPDLLGAQNTAEFVRLRTARRYAEARALSGRLWAELTDRLGVDRHELMLERIRAQYAQVFAAIPAPAYLTYGNVDLPRLWPEYLQPGQHVLDGASVELDGLRFGFVGGGLVSPMNTPYELTPAEYAAKVEALGPVDVLCSHLPPALPELTYDTVARRFEIGSAALLDYIRDVQPTMAIFGHVHQPFAARARVGRTECVNVGHFRGRGAPYLLRW